MQFEDANIDPDHSVLMNRFLTVKMKNIILQSSWLYFLFSIPFMLQAQDPCTGLFNDYYLNANFIKAAFFPRGNKFTTGYQEAFLVPYPSADRLSTIFASSIWLGGFDDAGNLKYSVETYPKYGKGDFLVGPLNSIGLPYDTLCPHYDKMWNVWGDDIRKHIMDYQTDFDIDTRIPSVFGWPARGNPWFAQIHGFELPPMDNQGLADFWDNNGNAIYDPENGDYPCVYIGSSHGSPVVPDQMLWSVFNDWNSVSTGGNRPILAQIHQTAFAFNCQENSFLNNTIFVQYKIINRAVLTIDSLFFGTWTDYDLGCATDDFIGVDSARSTEFVYNADAEDGDAGGCIAEQDLYPDVPPIQSLTYLNHPMHSFIEHEVTGSSPLAEYRLLNGMWADGNPMFAHGDGHITGARQTRFLFHGDPRDTTSWSARKVLSEGKDFKTVSSVSLGRMDPGQTKTVTMAYMYHHDSQGNYLDQITHMYNNVDSLLAGVVDLDELCTPYPYCQGDNCVWPGDFNHDRLVDHRDLLYWGVAMNSEGPARNKVIGWRGQFANEWGAAFPDGTNFKHCDGDGNGVVDMNDLLINIDHFSNTAPGYYQGDHYPVGPHLIIESAPMDADGNIHNLLVKSNVYIENLHGIAFEIDYDTSLFEFNTPFIRIPNDSANYCFFSGHYVKDATIGGNPKLYSMTSTNGNFLLEKGFYFVFGPDGLLNKYDLPLSLFPDTILVRLKNLVGIDAAGNDLHLGAATLKVPKYLVTGMDAPVQKDISVFPNPVDQWLHVVVGSEEQAMLYSTLGQPIRTLTSVQLKEPIDVSYLPPGIYFLQLHGSGQVVKFTRL